MMKKPFLLFSAAAVLCCCATIHAASFAYVTPKATPLTVNVSPSGPNPPGPSVHTVINTNDSGPGSLRQAIASAAPGDTISFALRFPAKIVVYSSLEISQDVTIAGPGPHELTIMRSEATNTPSFRVFLIRSGVVTLSGLAIRNGSALAIVSGDDNLGGAIYSAGVLTVSNCVLAENVAPTEGTGNGFGGAIFSTQGMLTLLNSTIRDNSASYAGGGVCLFAVSNFVAEGCTFNDNFAGLQGGGINFQGQVGLIQNCTISGNKTPEVGTASGLLNVAIAAQPPTTLTVTACTITRNTGNTNGAFVIAAVNDNFGLTNILLSTIVARNDAPNFFLDHNPTFIDLGYNLDGDGSSGMTNGVNGDIVGSASAHIHAHLGRLLDNGGPTKTDALLPGSPALGAGSCNDASGAPLLVDQRGFPRDETNGCDMGAFENQPPTVVCPEPRTVEGDGHDGEEVHLNAVVSDPDGDALRVVWSVDGEKYFTENVDATHPPEATAVTLRVHLSKGTHTVSISVSDGKAPPVECSTTITVTEHEHHRR